jgi:hypothetical protein
MWAPVKRKDEKAGRFFDFWREGKVWQLETSDFRGFRRFGSTITSNAFAVLGFVASACSVRIESRDSTGGLNEGVYRD